jgi:hypothetical protein
VELSSFDSFTLLFPLFIFAPQQAYLHMEEQKKLLGHQHCYWIKQVHVGLMMHGESFGQVQYLLQLHS